MSEYVKGRDYWTITVVSVGILMFASVIGPIMENIGATDTTTSDLAESNPLSISDDDDEDFIETVEVPLGKTGFEAVRKANPGIFYEYTDYDDSQIIGHKGFVILEKDKIEGTRLLFDGLEVEIIKIGGHYKVQPTNKINTEWCVVYRLPFISSDGKPIFKNAKYVEFHFDTDDMENGKYAYLVLSKKE